MEAERAANKYKQVEYMKAFVGNEFEAVISGVASFGFWAETTEHKCEGLVAASELMDIDQFVWNEREYSLAGRYTGMRFAMGDKVTIKVLAANLAKRQLDYGLVGLPPKQKRKQAPAKQQQKGKQTKKNNNKKRK
jgi:ribonuclease R